MTNQRDSFNATVLSANAKCCFFHWTNSRSTIERLSLNCEGVISGTCERVEFKRQTDKFEHMKRFCCGDYLSCPRARALFEKY